jgi:hypothetical protein
VTGVQTCALPIYGVIMAVILIYYFMSARRVATLQRDVQLLEDEAKRRQAPAGEAGAQ